MRPPIDFYFDFSSPYSYIASEWVQAVAARHGRAVQWRAILLGATFQAAELKPPVAYPLKREYSLRDFVRSARFAGVPFEMPGKFPIPTQNAARIFWWLHDGTSPEAAVAWAHAGLRAYFTRGVDLSEPAQLRSLLVESSVDVAAAEAAYTNAAVERPPEARERSGDRQRRFRRAVFHRRWRAVLGQRPPRAARSVVVGAGRLLSTR